MSYATNSCCGSGLGAWWSRRGIDIPLAELGGTYLVTTGWIGGAALSACHDSEYAFARQYRHHYGAVIDDFGNRIVVGREVRT